MTPPARPAPVVRYLRRPLWWALGVAVFVVIELVAQGREVRADAVSFADPLVVVAEASPVDGPTGAVDVRYTHPVTGETVSATFFSRSYLDRRPDGRLDLQVSRTEPTTVRPVGETRDDVDELPFLVVLLAVPFVSWGLRRWHVRRLEALMAADQPSYAMLGAVAPPEGLHRRWRLFLYPVDARPGSDPVCAVELVWLPRLVHGAFDVEVKGDPRSFGLMAVRAGDEVLWPRGRGLATRASRARPEAGGGFEEPPGWLSAPPRRPSLWPSRLLRLAGLAGLGVCVWLGHTSSWNEEQFLEHSRPVTATVTEPLVTGPARPSAEVVFRVGDAEARALLPLESGYVERGQTVAIRYEVDRPSVVWAATMRGPPDPVGDMAIAGSLAVAGGGLVLAAMVRRQELARLGVWELATAGHVDLGTLPVP